jgi:hypothetical protein
MQQTSILEIRVLSWRELVLAWECNWGFDANVPHGGIFEIALPVEMTLH